jgi:hypothetical protein
MSLAPGARLRPYEITGAIGSAGMGEVYRARDTKLNRIVAIKGGLVDRRLTWIDRSGKPLQVVGPPVSSTSLRLSPDGTRVALNEMGAALLEPTPGRAHGGSLDAPEAGLAPADRGTLHPT